MWALGASLLLHTLLIFFWPSAAHRLPKSNPISVSLLEPRERPAEQRPAESAPESRQPRARRITRMPREAPTRPSRAPMIVARKSSPAFEEKPITPRERQAENDLRSEQAPSREPPRA